jgi:glycosyltransferase involved in cell wall biosynthesis
MERVAELVEALAKTQATSRPQTVTGAAGMKYARKCNVVIVTYNQAGFIEQAVRGAMAQRTGFDFNVIVGDDCSTDGTADILRKLEAEFGKDKLRVLYAEKNIGMMANYRRDWAAADGQYVAFLEGDDYWTDGTKLQRQSDFLDAHDECVLCFTDAVVFFEGTDVEADYRPPGARKEILGIEDILEDVFIQTSTVLMRNKTIPELPSWADGLTVGDWPFFIHCAMYGKLGYVKGVTTAYRKHVAGIWHSAPVADRVRSIMTMYDRVNDATGRKYDREIQVLKRRWTVHVHQMDAVFKWLNRSEGFRKQLEESEQQRRQLKKELARYKAMVEEQRSKSSSP